MGRKISWEMFMRKYELRIVCFENNKDFVHISEAFKKTLNKVRFPKKILYNF